MGHLGRYRCPNCGRERPAAQVAATRVELLGMKGSDIALRTPAGPMSLRLPLPGLYNVYNALAAAASAFALGAGAEHVRAGLEQTAAVFGRVETIPVAGRDVSILLVKNPAGANEVLRTLTLEDGALDLWLALNDRIADGRDVSWIWDADFEVLAGRVRRVTCSGTRAEEMALRLKYAGIDAGAITVDRDLGRSLDSAVADRAGDAPLYALPTYTALLELRDLLAERGIAGRWSD
jgi:UDP-N-acetylmuramyl tripeptide synthase